MYNRESIDTCGEVCEQPLWRRERERQTQFATTSYSNLRWLFWRSNGQTLFDRATIFIEDSPLIFLQFGRWDCLLQLGRSVRNFVKSCCPGNFCYRQSWLFQKSNSEIFSNCSKKFTGVLPLTFVAFGWSDLRSEL